jgi:hypothetical protein
MLKAQSDKVMVSGAQVGSGLIGHWTFNMNPPSRKHVVSTGSELSSVDPVGGQRLIGVWSLQSEFVG